MTTINDKLTFDFATFDAIRTRSFGRLSWRLKRYIDSYIEPRLQALGHTNFKLSYLSALANIEEHGTTNSELARRACVTKQMMSKTISLLEQEGYIQIEKNQADCRSSIIYLNERGKQLFIDLYGCMQSMHTQFEQIMGRSELDALVDQMLKLVNGLESLRTGDDPYPSDTQR